MAPSVGFYTTGLGQKALLFDRLSLKYHVLNIDHTSTNAFIVINDCDIQYADIDFYVFIQ